MPSIDITPFQQITGPMEFLGAVNYAVGGLFIVLVILVVTWIAFRKMEARGYGAFTSASYSSLGGFILTLICRVFEYNGYPLVADWFVIVMLLILGVSSALAYVSKRSE